MAVVLITAARLQTNRAIPVQDLKLFPSFDWQKTRGNLFISDPILMLHGIYTDNCS
jgi:hypothetical protein